MPKHLEKRKLKWYAYVDVPAALREHFGKRKFLKSLGTDSLSLAEELKSSVITDWKKQIALAKKSSDGSGNALLDNVTKVRQDTQRLEAEGTSDEDIKWIQEEVALSVALGERNDFSGDPTLANAVSVVTSGSFLFVEHIDEFLDSKTTEQKSKDMMRRDLGLFCKQFQFPEDVTRQKVIKWINVDLDPTKRLALGTKRGSYQLVASTGIGLSTTRNSLKTHHLRRYFHLSPRRNLKLRYRSSEDHSELKITTSS